MCFLIGVLPVCADAAEPVIGTGGVVLFVADDVYSGHTDSPREISLAEAEQFFEKARAAGLQGDVSASLRWASRALSVNPDHAAARRVLGYRRVDALWAGGYARRRLEQGETWSQEFGWIRTADLAHWNAGQRPLGKKWISAEDDARRHSKINRGWQIRTDHFRVRTNDSRRSAVQLALQLETVYRVWQQMFGGFYLSQAEVVDRIEGKKESGGYRSKPFQVIYYRSRDQYNTALLRQQPRIAMSLGIYFDARRESHFFAGPEQDPGTVYHEAVHQLFHESIRSAKHVGTLHNAWAMEGVACYFESLCEKSATECGRIFSIGSSEAGRLPAARHRRLVDEYYVPLQKLTTLGMTDLQRRDDVARLYSQSAGLATFFMQHQNGIYRQAFVDYLKQIYLGRDTPSTLAELTGQSYGQLDQQYLEYLRQLP